MGKQYMPDQTRRDLAGGPARFDYFWPARQENRIHLALLDYCKHQEEEVDPLLTFRRGQRIGVISV